MHPISRFIFSFFVNFVAIIIAANYIPNFSISGGFQNLLIIIAIFTVINLLIKPILTFILGPLIVLTLGLLSVIINAAMLKLLDFLSSNVTITTIESLIYATIIITLINIILNASAKSLFKSKNS